METHLPVRDMPREDESGGDYLCRVARINGYKGSGDLFLAALPHGERSIMHVAKLIGIGESCLRCLSGPWPSWVTGKVERLTVKSSWYNLKRARWCPGCLRDDHYMRAVWSLKLFVACPRHGVTLREACDVCGATFPSGRVPFKKCPCGRPFTEMRCDAADRTVIELMHQCQPIASEASPRMPIASNPLHRLTVDKMLLLLHSLTPLTGGRAQRKTGIVPNLHDVGCATQYVQECARMLTEWPAGFRTTLVRRADSMSVTTSIRRTFGPIYRVIYRELADGAYDFLRHEFEAHLTVHWPGTIDGRHRKLAPFRGLHDAVSNKEIRNQLSCSRATVKRLLADGTLRGQVLQSPTGRSFVVSDYASIESAKEKLRSFVDLRAASRELGISRPRVRLLLDAGLIRRETQRHKSGLRWTIPRAEVDRWLTLPGATGTECALDPKVSLAHVFKYRCRTDAAFIAIAQALSDGTLLYAGRVPGLRGISAFLVPQEDADCVIAKTSRLPVEEMTAQAAAKALSVKEEVIYHLMHKGLLGYRTHSANGRAIRLVTSENLQAFCSTYVALADAARRWQVSPKIALKRLRVSGFHPVTGPSVDGSRQYFCRTCDINSIV